MRQWADACHHRYATLLSTLCLYLKRCSRTMLLPFKIGLRAADGGLPGALRTCSKSRTSTVPNVCKRRCWAHKASTLLCVCGVQRTSACTCGAARAAWGWAPPMLATQPTLRSAHQSCSPVCARLSRLSSCRVQDRTSTPQLRASREVLDTKRDH